MRVCVCVWTFEITLSDGRLLAISLFSPTAFLVSCKSQTTSARRDTQKINLLDSWSKNPLKAFTTCYQATMAVCVVYSQRNTTCFMCLSYSSFMLPSVWQGEGGFLWTNLSILNPPLRKNKCIAIQVSFLQVSTHQPYFSSVFKYFSSSSSTAFLMKWSSDVLLVLTHCTTSHFWKSMFLLSIKKVHVYTIDDSMCHS